MIVIKVEMWPGGDESRAQEFARAEINNTVRTTVQSSGDLGDYEVRLWGGVYGGHYWPKGNTWRTGNVQGFNRTTRGLWDLLFCALRNIVGERNRLTTTKTREELNKQIADRKLFSPPPDGV